MDTVLQPWVKTQLKAGDLEHLSWLLRSETEVPSLRPASCSANDTVVPQTEDRPDVTASQRLADELVASSRAACRVDVCFQVCRSISRETSRSSRKWLHSSCDQFGVEYGHV